MTQKHPSQSSYKVPELLAPAGSFDKMKVAVKYGANAVYLAGQKFGLRSAADNFSLSELKHAVQFAHDHGVKVYITMNSFLFDEDLMQIEDFIKTIAPLGLDAAIVSDMGIATLLKKHSSIPLHVSTQASVNNAESATLWKKLGATRLIVGREVSIAEAKNIKDQTGLEVEMFIHGSMCMAYSGHCVISNYTQGRDSNRGGCAHSCRFEYEIATPEGKQKTHFMSSKDLNGLHVLHEMVEAGIDSIKVEGRMKSELYAAVTTKSYASALKIIQTEGQLSAEKYLELAKDLDKIPHRAYTEASLISPAGVDSVFDERDGVIKGQGLAGQVLMNDEKQGLYLTVRQSFNVGDRLEFVPFEGPSISHKVDVMFDMYGQNIERTKPSTLIKLPYISQVQSLNLVRAL
jgi:putative protease